MKKILKYSILFVFLTNLVLAEEVKVFEFTQQELDSLEVRKVRGAKAKTLYTLGIN